MRGSRERARQDTRKYRRPRPTSTATGDEEKFQVRGRVFWCSESISGVGFAIGVELSKIWWGEEALVPNTCLLRGF